MSKTCIIIAGPTAIGKTDLAIELAKHFSTEIISADSRQCFKELNIGVAKPSPEQLSEVPHHFIDSHSIFKTVTAADFEQYALQKADEIFKHHDHMVMVGGTGLYIKAFAEGLDHLPPAEADYRAQLMEGFEKNGMEWLQELIREKDPLFADQGEMQNPRRIMRALEVMQSTGSSILLAHSHQSEKRPFRIISLALQMDREKLYERINRRVDLMMEAGLLEEVRQLFPNKDLNALQTVGYRELMEYLDGKTSLEEAVENIKKNTRHYAKRQMTWFRNIGDYIPVEPDLKAVLAIIEKMI